jgi:hypothetical protein
VYNLLDLLGDLGGVAGVIISFMALFMTPVSEISFHLAAFKKLFTVNNRTSMIIKGSDTINTNGLIQFSKCSYIRMFYINNACCLKKKA